MFSTFGMILGNQSALSINVSNKKTSSFLTLFYSATAPLLFFLLLLQSVEEGKMRVNEDSVQVQVIRNKEVREKQMINYPLESQVTGNKEKREN